MEQEVPWVKLGKPFEIGLHPRWRAEGHGAVQGRGRRGVSGTRNDAGGRRSPRVSSKSTTPVFTGERTSLDPAIRGLLRRCNTVSRWDRPTDALPRFTSDHGEMVARNGNTEPFQAYPNSSFPIYFNALSRPQDKAETQSQALSSSGETTWVQRRAPTSPVIGPARSGS